MIGVLERAISAAIPPQDSVENPAPGDQGGVQTLGGIGGSSEGTAECVTFSIRGAVVEFTKLLNTEASVIVGGRYPNATLRRKTPSLVRAAQ